MSPDNGGIYNPYDAMDRWKILESGKKMRQALRRLRLIKVWSWSDYFDFVTVGVWREEQAEMFLAMGEDAMNGGAPSPYLGLENIERLLRTEINTTFHVVDHAGGITGLGSMEFEPEEDQHTWRLYDRNAPSILIANLIDRGQFCRTHGNPGTGKTNLACVVSEEYAKQANRVSIGNIRMLKPDPRFIYTRDAKALFIAISNLPEDTFWLFTHDEGGLSYSKPDQATRRVKDLDKLMYCVRKLGGSYNLIEQREDSVPKVIMDFAKNIFVCESKGVVSIEMRGPNLAFRDTVRDFPKTSLPFDTDDIAMFDINVDVQAIFSAISGSDNPKKSLREFMAIEEAPMKEYMEKVCAFPGCGKSLVGMPRNTKYCSNNIPPYHAQRDYQRKLALGLKEKKKEDPKSLEAFLA